MGSGEKLSVLVDCGKLSGVGEDVVIFVPVLWQFPCSMLSSQRALNIDASLSKIRMKINGLQSRYSGDEFSFLRESLIFGLIVSLSLCRAISSSGPELRGTC